MKKLLALSVLLAACSHSMRKPASEQLRLSTEEQATYHRLLEDSLQFFNTALRDPESGQYYDAISLRSGDGTESNSSVAATGMGLVTLALGDATGTVPGAYGKAVQSLRYALGEGAIRGVPYTSRRSKTGWFRHWFDARNGADNNGSRGDGYSTIDTAILVAGAQLAAKYFHAHGQDNNGELRKLADRALGTVDWASAIADMDKGKLYLNYDLAHGKT